MDTDFRALCAELIDALDGWHQAVLETGSGWVRPDEACLLDRARDALKRLQKLENNADLSPAPPAEGEVAELVEFLRIYGDEVMDEYGDVGEHDQLTRAADLLEQRHPAPVPVSERLPGLEDCDGEGRCWFLSFSFEYNRMIWSLEDRTYGCNTGFTHWLSYPSLPLPDQE